jgi:signal transduction histidine kinase/ActR/RegA family two-component response regulator
VTAEAASVPRNLSEPFRIMALLGGIAAIVLGTAALVLWNLRLHDIHEAERELATLDLVLVEETERTMQSVDLVLMNVRQHIEARGVASSDHLAEVLGGRDMHEILGSKFAGVPQVEALAIVAADGRVINLSRLYPVPPIEVADRDYFRALRDSPADVAVLTQPLRSRVTGKDAMFLGRRLTAPSGEFIGIVLATIDLGYFDHDYETLGSGDRFAVSLWHRKGVLITRFPALDELPLGDRPPFADIPSGGDPLVFESAPTARDPARVVAASAARSFPLVVAISETFEQVLSDWHRKALFVAAGAVLLIIGLFVGSWLLSRQLATYEALRIAIAERGKAVAAREEAEAQLRQAQKLEAIGQLTGGIAHDFNNLLTAVLGNLELLQRHSKSEDPKVERWTRNAIDAARRGAALTTRLLAFSRRQPLEPRSIDVASHLDSLSELLTRTLGDSIEVTTSVEPHLWNIFVDPSGLDNAILNIALNARDAMDGRGRLTITAANHREAAIVTPNSPETISGDFVRITISDTGRGIAKDALDRVFEPFYTTKPVGQGTGLGLSQVYGFVTQSGGRIRIASEIGRGTDVELCLPRVQGAAEADSSRSGGDEIDEIFDGVSRGTVLVVENDETVRSYAAEAFRDLGFATAEAVDATAALAILAADHRITFLFADVGLPGMNGRELVAEALALRPDLDVLFTTGYAQHGLGDAAQVDLTQPTDLIAKPFTRDELQRKLRIVLGRRVPKRQDMARA